MNGLRNSLRHPAIVALVVAALSSAANGADFAQLNAGNTAQYPAWSHDGQVLALCEEWFRFTNPHCCESGVRLAIFAYSQLHFLTGDDNGSYVSGPSFAPDGSIVFASGYSSFDVDIPEDIYRMNVAGGGAALAPHPAADRDPAVSPDGTLVAFASTRSGNWDVWIVPMAGGDPVQLTSHPGIDRHPNWSPDGSRIAFTSHRNGNQDIWAVSATGGDAVALTRNSAQDFDPSWSPDGELLAFTSDRTGNDDIWVVRTSNGAESQLTTDPARDYEPAWAPDGDRIAFTSERAVYRRIWIASNIRTVNIEPVSWSDFKFLYR